MHRLAFLLLIAVPLAVPAQSIVSVQPKDCIYRAGDNAAWAAPDLDETGWLPYPEWRSATTPSYLWVRCHVQTDGLTAAAHPALQVRLYSPYTLYLNGRELATFGNFSTGNVSLNASRSYSIAPADVRVGRAVIALRVLDRGVLFMPGAVQRGIAVPLEMHAGERQLLDDLRAREVLSAASGRFFTAVCYGIVGVLSFPLLALYFLDRSRTAILFLAMAAAGLSALRLNELAASTGASYPLFLSLAIMFAGDLMAILSIAPFSFMLARGRVPAFAWTILGVATFNLLPTALDSFGIVHVAAFCSAGVISSFRIFSFITYVAISALPFVVFWPYASIKRRIWPLAVLCLLWSASDVAWFLLEATALQLPGIPNLYAGWSDAFLNMRGVATVCVVAALVALLFREQRQITQERATLAGELQAASAIQRLLAPAHIDTAPGLQIKVAFHPMREVGGDFYLCRVLPGGRQRILLGDVSGKGAAAAMAAALLLGAAEERDADGPVELLSHLNRVLCRVQIGGFATCLCVDIQPNGEMILANAGHLNPFRDGVEVTTAGSLPLGIVPATEYTACTLQLAAGEALTFVSDGVIEARSVAGELFGFERTGALSTRSADEIARAALSFGQEDDITVLTLTMALAMAARDAVPA